MSSNLLRNGGFEADWSEERSHRCLIFHTDGRVEEAERGNIFTPPGWITWFKHGLPVEHDPNNRDGWAQPEVRDAWITGDATRVHSGQKAILFFTFFRVHDGGFLQQVHVRPGTRLKLSAWAHAWSNAQGTPHQDDPRWSDGEGVGRNHFFALEGQIDDEAARNFTFWVGIDPTGGTDPYADTVIWGRGAHIYNGYRPVPPVEAVAQGDTVTVFLRSRTLWPFKHNDAYWDDAVLEVVEAAPQVEMRFEPEQPRAGEPVEVTVTADRELPNGALRVVSPEGQAMEAAAATAAQPPEGTAWRWTFTPAEPGPYRVLFSAGEEPQQLLERTLTVQPKPVEVWGLPREQYARTYVLLPPGAGREWVQAILDSGAWEAKRWTIGSSADDAGIGALEDKTVIAINPRQWPSDLRAFFHQYYPRTRYVPLEADTPDELRRKLADLAGR